MRGSTEALVWMETGWDSLTKPGEPHKEAGVNWDSWRRTLWLQPSWGAHFTMGHWCGQAAFWSPLSSLLSTWAQPLLEGWPWPWNDQVPGQSDQQAGASTETPTPCSQLSQDTTPVISRPATSRGSPGSVVSFPRTRPHSPGWHLTGSQEAHSQSPQDSALPPRVWQSDTSRSLSGHRARDQLCLRAYPQWLAPPQREGTLSPRWAGAGHASAYSHGYQKEGYCWAS